MLGLLFWYGSSLLSAQALLLETQYLVILMMLTPGYLAFHRSGAWQLLWWALGVFMMWFLAYKMGMSTVPDKTIEVLYDDIGDVEDASLDSK